MTIYARDGTVHSSALSKRPNALWPLRTGIIIESNGGDSSVQGGQLNSMSLLLLERVLDEPQPVNAAAVGTANGVSILLSDIHRSLLLIHDPTHHKHSMWAIDSPVPSAPPTPVRCEASLAAGTQLPISTLSAESAPLLNASPRLATGPEPAPRLVPIWEYQSDTAAPASCCFITPPHGVAPPLLFLLQSADGHLYCFPLPVGAEKRAVVAGVPIASIPALTAQPLATSLSSLVVTSILVIAPTGQVEIYNSADDGTLRCMHRGLPPAPRPPLTNYVPGGEAMRDSRLVSWPPPAQLFGDSVQLAPLAANYKGSNVAYSGRIVQICCQPLSPVVTQCLQVLRVALAPRTYLAVLHAVATPVRYAAGGDSTTSATSAQWEAFCTALCDALGCQPFARTPGAAASGPGAAASAPPAAEEWSTLLKSAHHQRLAARAPLRGLLPVQPKDVIESANCSGSRGSCSPNEVDRVLTELHVLYESMKLDTLSWPRLYPFATVLATISARLRRWGHAHHYARDFGSLSLVVETPLAAAPVSATPLCIFHRLASSLAAPATSLSMLKSSILMAAEAGSAESATALHVEPLGADALPPPSLVPAACRLPSFILSLYSRIAVHNGQEAVSTRPCCMAESLVTQMVVGRVGAKHLECLPLGVALPLLDAIRTCRHHAPEGLSLRAYELIGRHDLARQQLQFAEVRPSPIALPSSPGIGAFAATDDVDGMGAVVRSSALLFAADMRLHEVRRLLCSSRPLALRLTASPDLSDHDMLHEQQSRLMLLCRRAMALPIGRGMFSLASAPPRLTEALRMAPLTLKGRMPSTAATIDLDLSALPGDQLHWPEFHNGVAAALRLCPPGCGTSDEGELGRNWIVYNKPRSRQHGHAGFLLGLGLQGHLLALANTGAATTTHHFWRLLQAFMRT